MTGPSMKKKSEEFRKGEGRLRGITCRALWREGGLNCRRGENQQTRRVGGGEDRAEKVHWKTELKKITVYFRMYVSGI